MKYNASVDVPTLEDGLSFFGKAFGFVEVARPVEGYAVLKCGDCEIGILERASGTSPAEGTDDTRRYARHWTPVHLDFYVDDFESTLTNAVLAGAKCERKFERGARPSVAFCSDPFGHGFCIIGRRADT